MYTTYPEGRERRQQPHGRIGHKLVLSFVLLVMVMVGGSGWVLFEVTERSLEQQMSERLVAIAQLVSTSPNGEVLRHLRPGAESYGIYKRLRAQLKQAKEMVEARRIYVFDQYGRSLLDTEEGVSIGREYHNWIRDRLELEQVWQGNPAHSATHTNSHHAK